MPSPGSDAAPPRDAEGPSRPPVHTTPYTRYTHSEATRLLCAGTYLDPGFRDATITELIEHSERLVPPSLGYDVSTVLKHALRARNLEAVTAVQALLIWTTGTVVVALGPLLLPENSTAQVLSPTFALPLIAFTLASVTSLIGNDLRGRGRSTLVGGGAGHTPRGRFRGVVGSFPTLLTWGLMAAWVYLALMPLFDGRIVAGLLALIPPVLLIVVGVRHRLTVSRILWTELSRDTFTGTAPETPRDPLAGGRAATLNAVAVEQFSRLALYNEDEPFLGAGRPHKPWSLVLELKPGPDARVSPQPLDGRRVLDLIVPRLAELAAPSSNVSRDRLNDLEMQECVFLPVGLPTRMRRDTLPYQDADVRAHLADATGEGAEQRRHFLRIRVGGWEEEVVTTVFVRVHTQGDLLVLEVLPYVLPPLRAAFHQVDGLTERSTRLRPSVLSAAPAVTVAVLFSGLGAIRSWAREWWLSTDDVPVRAPRISVRELGARDTWSIFQEMDINRYVRSIQDRITSGTHQALAEAGYQTDEFQQQVVHVSAGGVFVGGSMAGSIATGAGAQATTTASKRTEQNSG